MLTDRKPPPFLEILVHDLDIKPCLTGLSIGYEGEEWRCEAFADHLMEWLPEFALTWNERNNLGMHNVVRLLRKAAYVVYSTEKYSKRGEFGELLLHASIRQVFNTIPAISKIYYKDSSNDTVKGFDAVHVVLTDTSVELWLGEAKFYTNIDEAINDVIIELEKHTQRDYLRGEFALITNKIEDSWPHASKLKKLIDPNTSLDDIFECICIPVLLTYDSKTVKSYIAKTSDYVEAFRAEVRHYYDKFVLKNKVPQRLKIHLFLVPLKEKKSLQDELHKRLQAWHLI
jgi:hypothetical protein